MSEAGIKHDDGKPRWDLVQPLALEEYVAVLTHGAAKYGDNNWQRVERAESRYFAACLRHLWAWRRGETADPESGRHPLAHAMCCLAFLLERELLERKSP